MAWCLVKHRDRNRNNNNGPVITGAARIVTKGLKKSANNTKKTVSRFYEKTAV
jgi:hypothetical protein